MSDYHDVSENDDTRGGVRRISGYDWDIDTENPEFNFDDERPLFEFDPRAKYLDLQVGKEDDDVMTYQVLGKLADMTLKLLACWEKRAAAYHLKKPDPTEQNRIELWGFKAFWQSRVSNLYQLKMEERNDLRSYSVWKLEKIFGGKDEVKESKQVSKNISYFVKRIILSIVGNSLPCPLPYPVISNILSYLLAVKGAVNIGPVTTDDSRMGDKYDMVELYFAMVDVYERVKRIMFVGAPNTIFYSILWKNERLAEKFEALVVRVTSTELQISFEGLD